jgi:hypothetical protein
MGDLILIKERMNNFHNDLNNSLQQIS